MMNKRIFLNVVGLAIFACTIVIATYSLPPGYESNSGPAKLAVLWQNILSDNNHSGSWFGFLDMSMLLLRSDWVTGHTLSDIMPDGRKKLIHTVGGIAKGKIVWTNTNKYTGMFKAANNVLVRLSTAQEASVSDGLTPAMAIKAFRDGVPSGNIIGMYELDGQPSLNFFEHNLCTHLADRPTLPLKLKLLGAKFKLQSSYPGCLGLSEFASFTETGSKVLSPSFPWALVFQVNPALTKSMSTNTNTDIAGALVRGVPQGTILYKIYAVPDPWSPNQLEELGYIQTTSPFRASAFGDLTVFFKHTFEEEDLTIRTDWADYFGDSTAQRWQTEGRAIYEPFLPAF